ncbi:SMC-Scp complex subunit ScpB [Coralloluteibacterium stylophorae]|uniref:SMC-Scp complex subunit ScpB n=1 Tax=Coralloluteibacterium stylophorae TaxID=1776034 RepID=A0A8J7VU97_9GAMM|nr:SMC-Scp complex subunit ScpB [Coralloluteibacterium stylophorae]MBS7457537.1 SMC-Scp complex subunit ScpB [Coralloluteibacterium stylophorae]
MHADEPTSDIAAPAPDRAASAPAQRDETADGAQTPASAGTGADEAADARGDAPAGAAAPPAALVRRVVEAALLAAPQPQTLANLYALFSEERRPAPGSIEHALEDLRADCAERGVELVEVASGFRFQVAADVHPWITGLWAERPTRYTRATLETLALIAYRQPITRGEIEQIRGVAVSSNIIKSLEEREWIRVIGHRDVPGRPALFGTTRGFLDYFGLKSLDALPPLSELRDLNELDPQLPFDTEVPAAARVRLSDLPDEDEALEEDADGDDGDALPRAEPDPEDVPDSDPHDLEDGNTHDPTEGAEALPGGPLADPADAATDTDSEPDPTPQGGRAGRTPDAVATTTVPTEEADAQGDRPEHSA